MAEYLERQGISADRVITEDASLNTQENILFSLQKIDADTGGRGTEQHVGIVTNNFHVFRAMSIARHLGMEHAVGISGDVDPVYLPNNLLRECLGIAKDTLTGNM